MSRVSVTMFGTEVFTDQQADDGYATVTVGGKTTKLKGDVELELRGTWEAPPEDTAAPKKKASARKPAAKKDPVEATKPATSATPSSFTGAKP